MNIKIAVIERVLKWAIGGGAFKDITDMVELLMDVDKTNDEKRKEVWEAVSPFLTELGKLVFSTAVAFAVDKYKIGEADGK